MWNGKEYSVAGEYIDTLQSTQGCDSIVTLILKVLPEVVGTEESVTICYGESYTWQGVDYLVFGIIAPSFLKKQLQSIIELLSDLEHQI